MKSTVNLLAVDAEIEAARVRTGRDVHAIYADWAACAVYLMDLNAACKALAETALVDTKRTNAALSALALSAHPQTLQVAGLVLRRTDPEGEAKRLRETRDGRNAECLGHVDRHTKTMASVDALVVEIIKELNRAGVTTEDGKATLRASTTTRLAA